MSPYSFIVRSRAELEAYLTQADRVAIFVKILSLKILSEFTEMISVKELKKFPDWVNLIAETLMQALKERDPYTYGHCRRVARNARLLAESAGLSAEQAKIIEYSSLFHDLGKLGIPDNILLKPGRLSAEEADIIRQHPIKSAEIVQPLSQIQFFKETIPGILHHHERMDGRGYPYRLIGDEIPMSARIILIADTFDAMTTTRPYRKGLPIDLAFKELKNFAGRQFDSHLVKIFVDAQPTWGEVEEEISETFVATKFKRAA